MNNRNRFSLFIIHCLHYSPVFRDKLLFHALQLVRHTGVQAEATQFDDVSSDQAFVHLLFQDYLTVRLLGASFCKCATSLGELTAVVSFPMRMCLSS